MPVMVVATMTAATTRRTAEDEVVMARRHRPHRCRHRRRSEDDRPGRARLQLGMESKGEGKAEEKKVTARTSTRVGLAESL